ncbi:type II secretion system protein [Saccharospirillum mangrovi]|uniref:type II secretion system protein n=1 Tax=Saccharospirillum mangrovi TaxID=2161747 RepID=UPI000D3831D3|nr:prepilin-type N-terminal cleavage/methylation domain-containing protein [Saccharospirillum mangrovi]
MKKQQGFTLIELIMVIVVLGILSAFALPRFVDFSSDASTAALEGALGSVKSSSAIAHAACLASPTCDTSVAGSTVDMEGSIDMDFGYPGADDVTSGIVQAANLEGFGLVRSTKIDGDTVAGLIITNKETFVDNEECVFYIPATASTAPSIGLGKTDNSGTASTAKCSVPATP